MRKLKSLVIAAVLFLGVSTTVSAQSKVGYINLSELIPQMPEVNAANEQIKKLEEGFTKDLTALVTEFRTKADKYNNEAATAGDALNETRGKELQSLQERIETFQQTAQQELQKKEFDLKSPILEKARVAIQKVAKAKGYNIVLDSTVGGGVLMAEGADLMQDVKTELKLK
nr:OmpH family outer membrane protein [uncultured Flavobacterium sp.]